MRQKAFTLTEVLVTVILVEILAFFAIQTYVRTMERGRGDNAVATLRLIRTAQRMYALDNNAAFAPDLKTLADNNYLLNPNSAPPKDRGFNYETDDESSWAIRNGGTFAGGTIDLDHEGAWTCSGGWPFCP